MADPLGAGHHTRCGIAQFSAGYSTIDAFLIRSANLPPNFMRTDSVAAMNGALSMSVMTLTPAALRMSSDFCSGGLGLDSGARSR